MSLTTPDPPPPPGDEEQAPDISFESGDGGAGEASSAGNAGGAADTSGAQDGTPAAADGSGDTPATDEDVNPGAAAPEPPD